MISKFRDKDTNFIENWVTVVLAQIYLIPQLTT